VELTSLLSALTAHGVSREGITGMPAGLSAQRELRRVPDSSTEQVVANAPHTSSSNPATVIHPEEDLPWFLEHQRESGTVSIVNQGSPVIASPYDHSLVRLAEPQPLIGQNCTIVRTDVVGFSSSDRTPKDRYLIRNALFGMTDTMLQDIANVKSEDRGDGMLTVVWPDIPTWMITDRLLRRMLPALLGHNRTHSDSTRFQLRAAIDVGPVISDRGFAGDTLINVTRLVDALPFKKIMETSGASLGVIVTNFVYDTVLKHNRDLASYCQVRFKVKQYKDPAWMSVFDTEISPHSDPDPAVAC
jgi:class 3 adenylate cyclase